MTISGQGGQALSSPMECCMCGDAGLSDELLRCKVCKFRSQHRYCSNVYPKAKSYRICNWCLSTKKEEKSRQNSAGSASSSSPCKNKNGETDDHKSKTRVRNGDGDDGGPMRDQGKRLKAQLNRSPTKKQGGIIRSNNEGIIKRVTRNRVRRYKLLEEVAC